MERRVSAPGRLTVGGCFREVRIKLTRNALPVDVASGSCPEVRLWDITLLAKSYCSTCLRSRFLGSFTDHFDGLPTNRQSGLLSRRQPDDACSQRNYSGEVAPVWLMRVIAVSQVPWMAVGER